MDGFEHDLTYVSPFDTSINHVDSSTRILFDIPLTETPDRIAGPLLQDYFGGSGAFGIAEMLPMDLQSPLELEIRLSPLLVSPISISPLPFVNVSLADLAHTRVTTESSSFSILAPAELDESRDEDAPTSVGDLRHILRKHYADHKPPGKLFKHFVTRRDTKVCCGLCSKRLGNREQMNQHIMKVHCSHFPFGCREPQW